MNMSLTNCLRLIRARQDSVVKRKRTHQTLVSADRLQTSFQDVPMSELDEQIKTKSRKGLCFFHSHDAIR
jgi:hypothetical protein